MSKLCFVDKICSAVHLFNKVLLEHSLAHSCATMALYGTHSLTYVISGHLQKMFASPNEYARTMLL